MKLVTNRLVSRAECSWLDDDVPQGTVVFEYFGCTYGCISPRGTAVTLVADTTPFFELPSNALAPRRSRYAAGRRKGARAVPGLR